MKHSKNDTTNSSASWVPCHCTAQPHSPTPLRMELMGNTKPFVQARKREKKQKKMVMMLFYSAGLGLLAVQWRWWKVRRHQMGWYTFIFHIQTFDWEKHSLEHAVFCSFLLHIYEYRKQEYNLALQHRQIGLLELLWIQHFIGTTWNRIHHLESA